MFSCGICSKSDFLNVDAFLFHWGMHEKSNPNYLNCMICGSSITTEKLFKSHMRTHAKRGFRTLNKFLYYILKI